MPQGEDAQAASTALSLYKIQKDDYRIDFDD